MYFAGDTGLKKSDDALDSEVCPVFSEIGTKCGPIDLALIPIGAYSPRWFMCSHHLSPEDAVVVHREVRATTSIGIHWGTFPMTDEPQAEPPVLLAAAVEKAGLSKDAFIVVKHGETWPHVSK